MVKYGVNRLKYAQHSHLFTRNEMFFFTNSETKSRILYATYHWFCDYDQTLLYVKLLLRLWRSYCKWLGKISVNLEQVVDNQKPMTIFSYGKTGK